MTDVFISYSRKNTDFARKLTEKLRQNGKESWVDWEGIPLSSPNWWHEIMDGIDKADNFVFIMSKDSMASVVCQMELDYALDYNKRVIIVVYEDVSQSDSFASIAEFIPDEAMQERLGDDTPLVKARDNWVRISHINWLFFRETDDFDSAFKTLVQTVETNLDYVKSHTRYQERAREWESNKRRIDLLLFGDEITLAEQWLAKGEQYAEQFEREKADSSTKNIVNPLPQDIHYEYIRASRAESDKRAHNLQELEDSRKRSEQAAKQAHQEAELADKARKGARRTMAMVAVLSIILIAAAVVFTTSRVSTAQAEVDGAATQVADANQALTAIPPTLTQVSDQVISAQEQANVANTQVGVANDALTAVPPTLTQVSEQVIAAQEQANIASTEAAQAENDAVIAQATVTVIPPTLTQAAILREDAELQQNIIAVFAQTLLNLQTANSPEEAIVELNNLVEMYPDQYMVYQVRGLVYSNLELYELAISDYTRAIELDPNEESNYFNRSTVYTNLEQYELAITDLARAIEINPEEVNFYSQRGVIYGLMEQYDQAISDLTRTIELDPEYTDAYINRGTVFSNLGQFEQAIEDYMRVIELDPEYADAYSGLGDTYWVLGNLEEAVIAYRQYESIMGELEPAMIQRITNIEAPEFPDTAASIITHEDTIASGAEYSHTYAGSEGEIVRITTVANWDTILEVFYEGDSIGINDDAEGLPNNNSQIILTLTESGEYTIVVTGYDESAYGDFTLTIESDRG